MKTQNACKALKIGPWQGIGKHKTLVAVGFVLLALALAACGQTRQAADASTSEATVVVRVVVAPSPTKGASGPEPTKPPTPAPVSPTATSIPPSRPQQSSDLTLPLKIGQVPSDLPKYVRNEWRHWSDDDKDCQNTRHEVLLAESLKEVTFKSEKQCQVATGEWLAPYTGFTVTDATKLDVDHMVPLKNAHDSGGWAWDKGKKTAYANEMEYAGHLIAVTASANRKKGAKGPEDWKPADQGYWCDYAVDWVQIKVDWELSATEAEWTALQEMLRNCDSPSSITAP